MDSNFSADFFAGNRRRLLDICGEKLIVLTANGLLQSGGDSAFPFRQDASFWYLTGIDEPDVILVISEDEEYLIVPSRDEVRIIFEGAIDKASLSGRSGIKEVLDEDEGWRRLKDDVKKVKSAASLAAPPSYVEQIGLYTNPARSRLLDRLKKQNSKLAITDLGKQLARLRVIKQVAELEVIRQAINITVEALAETLKEYGYKHEYEIEASITHGFRARGATGHAFDPIVASGGHACALHYVSNNGHLNAHELIVLDVGAEVEHYAADVTRTISLGRPGKRQTDVHAAVLDVHQYACSLLRPGVTLKDYEEKVERFMGEKLKKLGLIKTINSQNIRRYYPHATSHFLGLNAHDVGDRAQPLEPSMVLTVEPGIYIPEEGLSVRIEDDVLITADGLEVLSQRLPRGLA